MGMGKGYSKSKTRDFEVPPVKGSTPRAFETNPNFGSGGNATHRGTNTVPKIKTGDIPNRKG